jgi:hypothetical protein
MRKILFGLIFSIASLSLLAQNNPSTETAKKKKTYNLSGRSNDHLMIQLGGFGWSGKPDSIHTKGLSRSFNAYFLFDFPFKTNPHFSAAIGAGIGSDHIYFDKTYVGIKDVTSTLHFTNQADTSHFKKTKLATVYLEAPVELRYTFDPENNAKSFKLAVGAKIGTLVKAYTRSKDWVDKNGASITSYVQKEYSKRFFNTNRLVLTARAGWGHYSLFFNYQVGVLFKNATAADMHPRSFGLTISGL